MLENYTTRDTHSRKQVLFRDFAAGFFDDGSPHLRRQAARGKHFGENHLDRCRSIMRNYLLPQWGLYEISGIRNRQIYDWFLSLQPGRYGYDLSAASKNKILSVLRTVLRDAEEQEHLTLEAEAMTAHYNHPAPQDLLRQVQEARRVEEKLW